MASEVLPDHLFVRCCLAHTDNHEYIHVHTESSLRPAGRKHPSALHRKCMYGFSNFNIVASAGNMMCLVNVPNHRVRY